MNLRIQWNGGFSVARTFFSRAASQCLNLFCVHSARTFTRTLTVSKHGANERYNSGNYAEGGSRCIGTKEGQVRTWVKKDSYHSDVVRATIPGKAGEFGRPGWRVRITKPTLWTIDHASTSPHPRQGRSKHGQQLKTQRARTSRATRETRCTSMSSRVDSADRG